LQYASQYEALGLGAVDQAQKIRKRLGDNEGSAFEGDPVPDKPKGMPRLKILATVLFARDGIAFRGGVG
jgi:hypothetical protein